MQGGSHHAQAQISRAIKRQALVIHPIELVVQILKIGSALEQMASIVLVPEPLERDANSISTSNSTAWPHDVTPEFKLLLVSSPVDADSCRYMRVLVIGIRVFNQYGVDIDCLGLASSIKSSSS